jgi:hypothetical protein
VVRHHPRFAAVVARRLRGHAARILEAVNRDAIGRTNANDPKLGDAARRNGHLEFRLRAKGTVRYLNGL